MVKAARRSAKKFEKSSLVGQSMSYHPLQAARMKTYPNRARRSRSTLIPVPYSVRPDRLERGIRMLRALRLSLGATPTPRVRAEQCEFAFYMARRSGLSH